MPHIVAHSSIKLVKCIIFRIYSERCAWQCLPCVLKSFVHPLGHFVNSRLFLVTRQQVCFVEYDDHAGAGELTNQKALCCLCLHTFHNVNHQHHQINDLSTWMQAHRWETYKFNNDKQNRVKSSLQDGKREQK